jgi:hypothetical protein
MTQHHHGHSGSELPRKKLHQDWRVWAAVVLMLAAILIYVLTLDDSLLSLAHRTWAC